MNDLPSELLIIISQFLHDIDFIRFIRTSKYIRSIQKERSLVRQYALSKILAFISQYSFTNILYDFNILRIQFIPKDTQIITFYDDFNDSIKRLNNLSNLRYIHIGHNFTHIESIKSIPNSIINKKELILTVIANITSKIRYSNDIKRIDDPSDCGGFPGYYNSTCINKINLKDIKSILAYLDEEINDRSCNIILNRIKSNIYISFIELMVSTDYYSKYQIFYLRNSLNIDYIEENRELFKEFFSDMYILFVKEQQYLSTIYDKVLKKYHCSSIDGYTEICKSIRYQ